MHHRRNKDEKVMPEVHLDFMFLAPKDSPGDTVPCLVMREVVSNMVMSAVIPRKTTGMFAAKRALAFLSEVGCFHGDLIVRSDQEPAITSLLNEVGRLRGAAGGGSFIVEASPVGSSGSNARVERATQSVQDQVRVMRVALQGRWKVDVSHRHAVFPWMLEYAAHLLNRYEVGRDGRTAYERLKAKKTKPLGMEFGEPDQLGAVLLGSWTRWDHGVFLGVKGKTGEIVIGARSGIFKARTVRRRSTEDRWNPKAMELVTGVPWRTSEDDDKVDGGKLAKLQVPEEAIRKHDEDIKKERDGPRVDAFFITKKDMEQHGYSAKCPGCASVIRGTTRQAHSAACRMRFGEILKSTEKYKRVEEKFDQHVARALERQDEEERKRRKVEQEKTEAAGTLDARESELMEAEEEVERDNKR